VRARLGYAADNATMDDFPPGLSLGTLRATSATLMVRWLGDQSLAILAAAARMQNYRLAAQALGFTPEEADLLLRDAQGLRAGSTPTEDDYTTAIDTAIQRLAQ
jgi:hypothetical protein